MRLVISVIHQKGGVGKTTLSVCLAGELAQRGLGPLLVDADPTESAQAWAKAVSKLESNMFGIDCGPNDYSLAAACALPDVTRLPVREEPTMRKLLVLAAALLIALPAVAAAKTKKPVRRQPQQQIACTVIGCVPVPRGCGQTPGRTWSGMPTGGDVIVCPPGVAPFR